MTTFQIVTMDKMPQFIVQNYASYCEQIHNEYIDTFGPGIVYLGLESINCTIKTAVYIPNVSVEENIGFFPQLIKECRLCDTKSGQFIIVLSKGSRLYCLRLARYKKRKHD